MKKTLLYTFILIASFALVQCTSNESGAASDSVTVNGVEFRLGTNSGEMLYNIIRSESQDGIWLEITEKPLSGSARIISIFANHEAGSHNGTYTLKNNAIGPGIAIPALLDAETGDQIAGGSEENQPSGTITISDHGGNHFKIAFNDVILDPGTATETLIEGSCTSTFKTVN